MTRPRPGPLPLASLPAAVLLVLACDRPAEAVIPGVMQPLQVLLSFIPQLLVGALVMLSLIFRLDTWRYALGRVRGALAHHPRLAAVTLLAGLAGTVALVSWPASAHGGGDRPGAPPPPPAAASGAAWSSFMGGPLRTGNADGAPGPRDGQLAWSFRAGVDRAGFASSAAFWNGRVYAGSDNHSLYCLDAASGEVRWTFSARHEIFSSPVVVDGHLFVGEGLHDTNDGRFYCIDAMTGKEIWNFPTHSHTESTATVVDGRVYTGAGDDGVYCLDARTGKKIWQFPGTHVDSSVVVADGRVWFGSGYGNPSVYCLDAADGGLRWKKAVRFLAWGPPAYEKGRLYIGTGNGDFTRSGPDPAGEVLCLDGASAQVLWTATVADSVMTAVALGGGAAFFGSHDGNLYCVDAATGKARWKFATGGHVVSSPAFDGERVYVGSCDGQVYAVHAADGARVWSFDARAQAFNTQYDFLASPTLAGGRLFIGCQNFFFFCLR